MIPTKNRNLNQYSKAQMGRPNFGMGSTYLAASTKAVLITFNGSMIPLLTISTYSPDCTKRVLGLHQLDTTWVKHVSSFN